MSSLPIDVAPLLDEFDVTAGGVAPITGRRVSKTQAADGTWRVSSVSPLSYTPCVITPAAKDDTLELVPEADRDKDRIRVYAKTEIRKADEIDWAIRGVLRRWRVVYVAPYDVQAGIYSAIAVLVDVQTPPLAVA